MQLSHSTAAEQRRDAQLDCSPEELAGRRRRRAAAAEQIAAVRRHHRWMDLSPKSKAELDRRSRARLDAENARAESDYRDRIRTLQKAVAEGWILCHDDLERAHWRALGGGTIWRFVPLWEIGRTIEHFEAKLSRSRRAQREAAADSILPFVPPRTAPVTDDRPRLQPKLGPSLLGRKGRRCQR